MKIVALEEHMVTPEVVAAWSAVSLAPADDSMLFGSAFVGERLRELGEERARAVADTGVDVQVLSVTTPGVQNLEAAEATKLAQDANDLIGKTVREQPERYEGFATLPTPDPKEAARELRRAIGELGLKGALLCGRTGERNMDAPEYDVIYETAAELRVPLYIHPQLPMPAVREAYYSGFPDHVNNLLAGGGVGWHYETAIQLLRLILAGTFDRHHDLQVIVGHWGEMILFYLDRVKILEEHGDLKLERPLADYFRQNVFYTPSGILSERYMQFLIDIVGVDRLMYSADYPFLYQPNGGARAFLEQANLSRIEKEKVAFATWEQLSTR